MEIPEKYRDKIFLDTKDIKDMLDLGEGSGPLSHGITVETKGVDLWPK